MFKLFLLLILIIVIAFSVFVYKKLLSYSLKDNYKTILIISLLVLLVTVSIFFYFIIMQDNNIDKQYFPPTYDGKKLVPGFFSDKK